MKESEPEVRDLLSSFENDKSDFEHLIDIEEFRYHLLLQFNKTENDCTENSTLNQLYDSFADDEKATNDAVNECMEVL